MLFKAKEVWLKGYIEGEARFLANHCVVLLKSEDLAGKSCSLQGHNSKAWRWPIVASTPKINHFFFLANYCVVLFMVRGTCWGDSEGAGPQFTGMGIANH